VCSPANRHVAAHDLRGTVWCSESLAELSRAAVPHVLLLCSGSHGGRGNYDHDSELMGRCAAEVMGVEVIVTMIPEPMGHRTYEMCGTIHFCAGVPPFC
jgi:hypothetical protein